MNLRLQEVSFQFGSGFVLEPISLAIDKGDFLGIIGPNGSGKSTLMGLVCRRLQPKSGSVLLGGRPLAGYSARELARLLAVIPSENHFEFPFRVREVVAMGRFPYRGRFQRLSAEDHSILTRAMRLTDCDELAGRPISQLSSGERQRVLLARAIAQTPRIMVLDEPNIHLDIHHQVALFKLLRKLNRDQGLTLVVVLHDLSLAAAFCRRIALLSKGGLVQVGRPSEVITRQTIQDIYGADLNVRIDESGRPQVGYWSEK